MNSTVVQLRVRDPSGIDTNCSWATTLRCPRCLFGEGKSCLIIVYEAVYRDLVQYRFSLVTFFSVGSDRTLKPVCHRAGQRTGEQA